ncbi:MAG: hypothetical protein ACKOC5_10265 [Chloroflexota bacterium]
MKKSKQQDRKLQRLELSDGSVCYTWGNRVFTTDATGTGLWERRTGWDDASNPTTYWEQIHAPGVFTQHNAAELLAALLGEPVELPDDPEPEPAPVESQPEE